jgi:hypothetical protein
MESKVELIKTTWDQRIYWITITGETKHGPLDSYITVRIDNLGGMEFENAAGGEKIFFHPEQVEQLERLLWERKGQGPKSANLPKRPKRKGRAK